MTTIESTGLQCRLVRDTFADAVSWAAKSLPSKPLAPVLAGVLLSGSDDGLTVSGFDYEVSTEVHIPAEVVGFGSALVSGRLLSSITAALPKKPIDIRVEGSRVELECGNARFSLPTMPVEDYPALPILPDDTGSMPADLFAEAISQVVVAAGKDESLPMLTGIRMEISGSEVVLAATDRFRLGIRRLLWEPNTDGVEAAVLVPAKALSEATKAGDDNYVRLALGVGSEVGTAGILGVSGAGRRSTTRLLDAEFPKFRQLIPAEHTGLATIDVAELMEAIKLAALVAERGAQVRLEFTTDSLRITAGGDDVGRAEQDMPVEFAGQPLAIAFNPNYLREALEVMHSERVSIGFTGPKRMAVLRPTNGDNSHPLGDGPFPALTTDYVHLLMPVQLAG